MTPFRLGLTGSIGMGKSTTAGFFAAQGVPVWDADAAVHGLYARGGAGTTSLETLFPAVVTEDGVDRSALRALVAADPTRLSKVERVIHPLVAMDRMRFLEQATAEVVVLDIPLLFETGADAGMDATLLVTAPPALQRARVMARPGMTKAIFESILARQMPDAEKRRRATHIIETLGLEAADCAVRALLSYLRGLDA